MTLGAVVVWDSEREEQYQAHLVVTRRRMRERDWGGPPPGEGYVPDPRPVGKLKDLFICPDCGRADYGVKKCGLPKPVYAQPAKPNKPKPKRDMSLMLENIEARWRAGKITDAGYDRELARWQRAFSESMPTR